MLFLLTGSAGAGKSAVLLELAARQRGLLLLDFDDLRPPADADSFWWHEQIERQVLRAREAEAAGRDTVLAGWTTLDELHTAPSYGELDGIAACLLDCDDVVRRRRIEQRAASGTWRQHSSDEADDFLRAAEEMRQRTCGSIHLLDTSNLSVCDVADGVEAWMAEQRRQHQKRA